MVDSEMLCEMGPWRSDAADELRMFGSLSRKKRSSWSPHRSLAACPASSRMHYQLSKPATSRVGYLTWTRAFR